MTTPSNWPNPERPGVPMFPERAGWHWLSNRPDDTPFPAEWSHEEYSDGHTEWFWDMGEEREDPHEMRTLYYRGPCPFPSAANETGYVALDNITTLTEQARKNIAVASGARKMAKAVFPYLAEIDRQVIAARNSIPILTPAQIAEIGRDSERLDWLESGCCDVRFRPEPIADTGDADVYCDIIQHHMAKPYERTIGSAETIRAAIDAAREVG